MHNSSIITYAILLLFSITISITPAYALSTSDTTAYDRFSITVSDLRYYDSISCDCDLTLIDTDHTQLIDRLTLPLDIYTGTPIIIPLTSFSLGETYYGVPAVVRSGDDASSSLDIGLGHVGNYETYNFLFRDITNDGQSSSPVVGTGFTITYPIDALVNYTTPSIRINSHIGYYFNGTAYTGIEVPTIVFSLYDDDGTKLAVRTFDASNPLPIIQDDLDDATITDMFTYHFASPIETTDTSFFYTIQVSIPANTDLDTWYQTDGNNIHVITKISDMYVKYKYIGTLTFNTINDNGRLEYTPDYLNTTVLEVSLVANYGGGKFYYIFDLVTLESNYIISNYTSGGIALSDVYYTLPLNDTLLNANNGQFTTNPLSEYPSTFYPGTEILYNQTKRSPVIMYVGYAWSPHTTANNTAISGNSLEIYYPFTAYLSEYELLEYNCQFRTIDDFTVQDFTISGIHTLTPAADLTPSLTPAGDNTPYIAMSHDIDINYDITRFTDTGSYYTPLIQYFTFSGYQFGTNYIIVDNLNQESRTDDSLHLSYKLLSDVNANDNPNFIHPGTSNSIVGGGSDLIPFTAPLSDYFSMSLETRIDYYFPNSLLSYSLNDTVVTATKFECGSGIYVSDNYSDGESLSSGAWNKTDYSTAVTLNNYPSMLSHITDHYNFVRFGELTGNVGVVRYTYLGGGGDQYDNLNLFNIKSNIFTQDYRSSTIDAHNVILNFDIAQPSTAGFSGEMTLLTPIAMFPYASTFIAHDQPSEPYIFCDLEYDNGTWQWFVFDLSSGIAGTPDNHLIVRNSDYTPITGVLTSIRDPLPNQVLSFVGLIDGKLGAGDRGFFGVDLILAFILIVAGLMLPKSSHKIAPLVLLAMLSIATSLGLVSIPTAIISIIGFAVILILLLKSGRGGI